jgi:DNA-binding response OmpR family regulator
MPGMSGLDLLEELRQRGDAVPVIVVTGQPSAASTARAQAAGALAVLAKPFKPIEMLGLVRQALNERPGPGFGPPARTSPMGGTAVVLPRGSRQRRRPAPIGEVRDRVRRVPGSCWPRPACEHPVR